MVKSTALTEKTAVNITGNILNTENNPNAGDNLKTYNKSKTGDNLNSDDTLKCFIKYLINLTVIPQPIPTEFFNGKRIREVVGNLENVGK